MLDAEHKMDAVSFKIVVFEAEVHGRHLEQMKHVLGVFLLWHILVHDFLDRLHRILDIACLIDTFVHVAVRDEQFFVQELLLAGHLFKRLWNAVIAVTNDDHKHVVLRELGPGVEAQTVVVVDHSRKRRQ